MLGKGLGLIINLIGVLWLGIVGGVLVYQFDRLPAGWPNLQVRLLWMHPTLHLPQSLGAQLAASRAQVILYTRAAATAAQDARSERQAASDITQRLQAAQSAAQARVVTITRTIEKEIPVVVTPAVDRAYPLPVGLLRAHDAAALGVDLAAVPDPAGRADDAASGFEASALARLLAENYAACHVAQQQVTGWQDWYRAQAAAWSAHQPAPPPAAQ